MKYALVAFRYIVTSLLALLLVLLLFALESCTVGPKYVKPSTPTPAAFKEQPPASSPGAEQWQPANPADQASRGKWWEIFGDPELNQLEEQVATSNQDLKVYEARFREARAAIRFNRASQFPTISTAPTIAYTKSTDYSPSFPSKIQETSTGEYRVALRSFLRVGPLGPRAANGCCCP